MKKHHVDILISEADVRSRITELGAEITHFYQQQAIDKLIVVGLLRGSFMFMADLVRELKLPVEVEFMTTSSYGHSEVSSGTVTIVNDIPDNIEGLDVIIVDDIIDTGYTMQFVIDHVKKLGAKSVKTCVLLDKPSRRKVDLKPDYCCFEIDDLFVVGYGLDYEGFYRNVPYVFNWENK